MFTKYYVKRRFPVLLTLLVYGCNWNRDRDNKFLKIYHSKNANMRIVFAFFILVFMNIYFLLILLVSLFV